MECRISLEPAAEAVSAASAKPPLIFELPPSVGREKLEETQNQPVSMYPAEISSYMVNTGTWGRIPMYLVIPECVREPADVIFYIHGRRRDSNPCAGINRQTHFECAALWPLRYVSLLDGLAKKHQPLDYTRLSRF